MTATGLARPEIRGLQAYRAVSTPDDAIKLHANEAPLALGTGVAQGLNRYPARRPAALTGKMAAYYGVAADNVLATRGSSEGIDLLTRTFCAAGRDSILLTPPAFEMYQVYASVQGARTIRVPLQASNDFALDSEALLASCDDNTKLIFLCSPNNPVGTVIPRQQILRVVTARTGRSVVIVDEAYIEYSDTDSLAPLVSEYDNLVVLRTLSKALALAGARCGAVIASAGLIRLLDGVLAPYALSSPVIRSAELALSNGQLTEAQTAVGEVIAERERLRDELGACNAVRRVWPSRANFLLVRFSKLDEVRSCLKDAGIAIRTYDNDAALENCARITIAASADNDRLVHAIRSLD